MRFVTLSLATLLSLAAVAQSGPAFRFVGGPWRAMAPVGRTLDGTLLAVDGLDLLASTDGGTGWQVRAAGFSPYRIEPAPTDTLLAVATDGVFRSSDAGGTWTREVEGVGRDLAIDGDEVYALIGTRVWRRRNGVWTDIDVPILDPTNATTRFPIALAVRAGRIAVGYRVVTPFMNGGGVVVGSAGDPEWARSSFEGVVRSVGVGPDGAVWVATVEGYLGSAATLGGLWSVVGGTTARVADGRVTFVDVDSTGVVRFVRSNQIVQGTPTLQVLAEIPAGQISRFVRDADHLVFGTEERQPFCRGIPPCPFISGSGAYAVRDGGPVHTGRRGTDVYALRVGAAGRLLAGGTSGAVHRLDTEGWRPTVVTMGLVRHIARVPGVTEQVPRDSGEPVHRTVWF